MPKIIGSNLAEHRAQVRVRLFEALSTLMAKRGFKVLTMSEIAKEAGVGRTAVYNHFEDKESLLLAFVASETGRYAEALEISLKGITDPLTKIRIYIREHLQLKPYYHLSQSADIRNLVSSETKRKLHSHAGSIEKVLREILTDAQEAGLIGSQNVTLVMPLIHACLAGSYLPHDPQERPAAIAATEEFVLRALGAQVDAATLPELSGYQVATWYSENAEDDEMERSRISRCPVHHIA